VCQQNLEEEEAMALWLSEHLAPTTDKFLSRAAADADTAKR
jgi:ferritin-like metal-binding protein YciE